MKASQNRILRKFGRGWTLVEMLVVIGMIGSLAAISFPVYRSIQKKVDDTQQGMFWASMERAVENFETEYNYLPYVGSSYPSSEPNFTYNKLNDLATVLVGGYTASNNANYKGIVFWEPDPPKQSSPPYTNGVVVSGTGLTKTATWYNSWGSTFRYFTMDYNMDGMTWQPYGTPAPTTTIQVPIIIFDQGEDNAWNGTGNGDDWCNCGQCDIKPLLY
ncbi:MAG: type II secretion system protein [Akkermansiaceae bacterium]